MIARGLTLLAVAWLARLVHEQAQDIARLRLRVARIEPRLNGTPAPVPGQHLTPWWLKGRFEQGKGWR